MAALAEAERWLRAQGPVTLSADYLAAVERLESLEQNQNGACKDWVVRFFAGRRDLGRGAFRVR